MPRPLVAKLSQDRPSGMIRIKSRWAVLHISLLERGNKYKGSVSSWICKTFKSKQLLFLHLRASPGCYTKQQTMETWIQVWWRRYWTSAGRTQVTVKRDHRPGSGFSALTKNQRVSWLLLVIWPGWTVPSSHVPVSPKWDNSDDSVIEVSWYRRGTEGVFSGSPVQSLCRIWPLLYYACVYKTSCSMIPSAANTPANYRCRYRENFGNYVDTIATLKIVLTYLWARTIGIKYLIFVGWFKRSLNQSIGSFSTNPHFALLRSDERSDISRNVSNHRGMVTYTFFWNNFFGSLIRARTGSFANVSAGTSPLYIKVGQILGLSKNGSWVLVDTRRFYFCRSLIRACTGRFKKLMI